jgi:hypothetical protein
MIFAPIVISITNFVELASLSPCLPNALTAHFKTLLPPSFRWHSVIPVGVEDNALVLFNVVVTWREELDD